MAKNVDVDVENVDIEKLLSLLDKKDQEIKKLKKALKSTKEKRTEIEKLKENFEDEIRSIRAEISTILNTVSDIVCVFDKSGELILWNKKAEKTFDSLEKIPNIFKDFINNALSGKTIVDYRDTILFNGKSKHFSVSAMPITQNGSVKGVVLTLRDPDELHELSEEVWRLKETLRAVPIPVLISDSKFNVTFVNEKFAEMFGYKSVDEVIGKKCYDVVRSNACKTKNCRKALVRKTKGKVERIESVVKTADGKEIPVLVDAEPILDLEGNLTGEHVEAFVDISEIKDREEQIREHLKTTDELFKSIPSPTYIFVLDMDRRIIYANRDVARLLGFESPTNLIGKRVGDLMEVKCDFEIEGTARTIFGRAVENEKEIKNLEAVIKVNEREIPIVLSISPVYLENEYIGSIAVFTDITELKRKEKELTEIFKNFPRPGYVYFIDADGVIKYISEAFATDFIGSKADELIGKRISDVIGIKTVAEKTLETGKEIIGKVAQAKMRDGSKKYLLVSGIPISYDDKVIGAFSFLTDITQLKEKEKQIKETLEYINKILERLSNGIRELQSGNLSIKLEKIKDDELNRIFDVFNEFTERLLHIIDGLARDMINVVNHMKEARDAVGQMNTGMQQISSASQQIATASENLSKLANASMVEVKSAKDLFVGLDKSAKESSKYVVELSKNANDMKERGIKSIEILNTIVDKIEQTASIVQSLGTAVRNIGKVTEKIKSIADQTNLLALNAAIEAARAGEHGRGFAVVADEIRKLAEESRKSTDEINEIITKVQEETKKVIDAVEDTRSGIAEGSKEIEVVLKRVEDVAKMINEISDMIQRVSRAADEGLSKIEQIAKSFEEVASTAEENAASSEETSAAIEEQTAAVQQVSMSIERVNEVARKTLETIIENFRLSDDLSKILQESINRTLDVDEGLRK